MQELSQEPAKMPSVSALTGERVSLVPLDFAAHTAALWEELRGHDELWRYLFEKPPGDLAAFEAIIQGKAGLTDPYFLAILDKETQKPIGIAAFMRIELKHRVIEVGNILFSPALQRTPLATEAMYLMARYAFDELGYRRYEWKCNALNLPSRKAALRFGFVFEGIFRQHMMVKGENRDTAWFSMLDGEWPTRRMAFEEWLAPGNFDAQGNQLKSLADLRKSLEM